MADEWVHNTDVITTDLDTELVLLNRTTRAVFGRLAARCDDREHARRADGTRGVRAGPPHGGCLVAYSADFAMDLRSSPLAPRWMTTT